MKIKQVYLRITPHSVAQGKRQSFDAENFKIEYDAELKAIVINDTAIVPIEQVNEIVLFKKDEPKKVEPPKPNTRVTKEIKQVPGKYMHS